MQSLSEKTTRIDQKIAVASIKQLEKTSKRLSAGECDLVKIAFQGDKEFFEIPTKAAHLLFKILSNMAEGKSITLVPSDAMVTTQQAAEILNVSRPFLVKLLENGDIPFQKAGTHRRIELKDIQRYESKLKSIRKKKLDFLSKQAQDLNLGY